MTFGELLHFIVGFVAGWYFSEPLFDISKKVWAEFKNWKDHR